MSSSLGSRKNSKFHYYGVTTDLLRRLREHERGKTRTTNRFLPIYLIGYVEIRDEKEALKYEKLLKRSYVERMRFLKKCR